MEVKLFAMLREGRGRSANVDWFDGINGHSVLQALGISPKEATIYLINGKNAKLDVALAENDVVSLFPPIGGG